MNQPYGNETIDDGKVSPTVGGGMRMRLRMCICICSVRPELSGSCRHQDTWSLPNHANGKLYPAHVQKSARMIQWDGMGWHVITFMYFRMI